VLGFTIVWHYWKLQMINPVSVDSGTVFQVAAKTQWSKNTRNGILDGINVLFIPLLELKY
jgi:hypothetical protein